MTVELSSLDKHKVNSWAWIRRLRPMEIVVELVECYHPAKHDVVKHYCMLSEYLGFAVQG